MFCETTHIAPNSHRKASQDRVDFSNKISTAGKFSSACIVYLVHIIAGFSNRKAFSNVQNDFYSIWEQRESSVVVVMAHTKLSSENCFGNIHRKTPTTSDLIEFFN